MNARGEAIHQVNFFHLLGNYTATKQKLRSVWRMQKKEVETLQL